MNLTLVQPEALPTLDELARTVRREDAAVSAAARSAVEHAIKAGEALNEAKRQIKHGYWEVWTQREFPNRHGKTLRLYMRLAAHAEAVREANPATVSAAYRLVVGTAITPAAKELQDEARQLRKDGMSVNDICAKLGKSKPTIYAWLDPKEAEKRRRRKQQESRKAKRALYRSERDSAARKAGGSISHGYAAVRKALEALTAAQLEESDAEAKAEISKAIERLHLAEDHIVRASKVSVANRKKAA